MKAIQKHQFYFYLVSAFIISALVLIATFEKAVLHLQINQYQSPFFDIFFTYATKLGEGFGISIAILAMAAQQVRKGLTVAFAAILGGVVSQFFKRIVFGKTLRPMRFFEELGEDQLSFVLPIGQMNSYYSFPSGHTTEIFALCTAVVLCLPKRRWDVLLAMLAILVGFSRVYLSQHFVEDICAGALLGTILGIGAYLLMNILSPANKKLNYSLLNRSK